MDTSTDIDVDRLRRWAARTCDTMAGEFHDGYESARVFVRDLLDGKLSPERTDDED